MDGRRPERDWRDRGPPRQFDDREYRGGRGRGGPREPRGGNCRDGPPRDYLGPPRGYDRFGGPPPGYPPPALPHTGYPPPCYPPHGVFDDGYSGYRPSEPYPDHHGALPPQHSMPMSHAYAGGGRGPQLGLLDMGAVGGYAPGPISPGAQPGLEPARRSSGAWASPQVSCRIHAAALVPIPQRTCSRVQCTTTAHACCSQDPCRHTCTHFLTPRRDLRVTLGRLGYPSQV